MSGVLLIDRGNYSVKAAEWESGAISRRWDALGDASCDLVIRIIEESRFDGVAFSSVVPDWTIAFRAELESAGVERVLEVGADIELPFRLLVESPEGVGPDRICAASGAFALGYREAVIVDAGTAVTVDVLSTRGFLGGSIFPGLDLLLRSLGTGTASLPDVSFEDGAAVVPGRSTEEAMTAGVKWGLVGAVNKLVSKSITALSTDAKVVVTGGQACRIASYLKGPVSQQPDLNFRGLYFLFKLNFDYEENG